MVILVFMLMLMLMLIVDEPSVVSCAGHSKAIPAGPTEYILALDST